MQIHRRGVFFAISLVGAFAIVGAIQAAGITTSADVRAATTLATQKGWCKVSKDERTADCAKQTTTCDAKEWSTFIAANVTFTGGGTPQRKTAEENQPTGGMGSFGSFSAAPAPSAGPGELLSDGVYSYLGKNSRNRESIPPLNLAACFCECPEGSNNSACEGKPAGTPYRIGTDLFTREECVALCGKSNSQIAAKCAGSLPTLEQADSNSTQGQTALQTSLQSADVLMMCFTQEECSTQKGTWEAYDQCTGGKGRCVAPNPTVELNTPIGSITSIQGFGNYVIAIFRYMLSIVVFVTTVMFIWGAFRYLVGSGSGSIGRGKEIMNDAVIGMILLLCSVAILRTINPATLKMNQVKIYMVNASQFIQSAYCKDLSSGTRLADAGTPPGLRDKTEVEKSLTAYSEAPSTADCGHSYYIKDSSGGTCQGLACPHPNEVCVSCASGEPLGCLNQKSEKQVCDAQMFAGSINYGDSRYPEQIYLVGVCGYAQVDPYQSNARDVVGSNLTIASEIDLAKIRQQVGSTATDEDVAGNAMYSFKLGASDIQKAVGACPNGFRGFLLGVQYNDGDLAGIDDVTLLSKQNCTGGKTVYDGYATGGIIDKDDIVNAFICGLKKTPARFLDSSGTYWRKEELQAAVEGRQAISCNFDLSEANAPSNPGEKDPFCPMSAAQQQAVQSAPACAADVKDGDECNNSVHTCSIGGTKLCTCDIDTSSIGFGGTAGQATARKWSCQ